MILKVFDPISIWHKVDGAFSKLVGFKHGVFLMNRHHFGMTWLAQFEMHVFKCQKTSHLSFDNLFFMLCYCIGPIWFRLIIEGYANNNGGLGDKALMLVVLPLMLVAWCRCSQMHVLQHGKNYFSMFNQVQCLEQDLNNSHARSLDVLKEATLMNCCLLRTFPCFVYCGRC